MSSATNKAISKMSHPGELFIDYLNPMTNNRQRL